MTDRCIEQSSLLQGLHSPRKLIAHDQGERTSRLAVGTTADQNHSSCASSRLFTRASGVWRWKSRRMERCCSPSAATARIG
jgi:hypothetical protein